MSTNASVKTELPKGSTDMISKLMLNVPIEQPLAFWLQKCVFIKYVWMIKRLSCWGVLYNLKA